MPEAARAREEQNHDSAPSKRGSRKKWARQSQREGFRGMFRGGPTRSHPGTTVGHRRGANNDFADGKGQEDLPHDGDLVSPTPIVRVFGRQSIDRCYMIRTGARAPLRIEKMPLEDRTPYVGPFLRSYGTTDRIIGGTATGCRTNSGSLLFGLTSPAWRLGLAGSGPGQGGTKSR